MIGRAARDGETAGSIAGGRFGSSSKRNIRLTSIGKNFGVPASRHGRRHG
jgi:hypothetical protein